MPTTSAASARARPGAAGPASTPWSTTRSPSPSLVRASHPGVPFYLIGESMGGAEALAAADRGLQADGLILSAPALRGRVVVGPVASGGLWFFGHTIPWLPAGPTSIDFKPTDNPEDPQEAAERSADAAPDRASTWATAWSTLMDAGYDAAETGPPALPDAARHGRPAGADVDRFADGDRDHAAARAIRSSPSTSTAIIC